jgi:mono/diheme cytochrome c family protein
MLRYLTVLSVAALLAMTASCDSGRHSASGFRLPPTGDIERGKAAFVSLGCSRCHEVAGVAFAQPEVKPAMPVVLGGSTTREISDGYLVTSIINPNHRLARYPKDQITAAGKSRMPEYADNITARQLTDIVEFLQSRYVVRSVVPPYPAI